MNDSFRNIQSFANFIQIVIAHIFKEHSTKPALGVCSQTHRNRSHQHGSTDTRKEALAHGNWEFFEIRRAGHDRKYLQQYCLALWQSCPSKRSWLAEVSMPTKTGKLISNVIQP
jgi:hypothetical protein